MIVLQPITHTFTHTLTHTFLFSPKIWFNISDWLVESSELLGWSALRSPQITSVQESQMLVTTWTAHGYFQRVPESDINSIGEPKMILAHVMCARARGLTYSVACARTCARETNRSGYHTAIRNGVSNVK